MNDLEPLAPERIKDGLEGEVFKILFIIEEELAKNISLSKPELLGYYGARCVPFSFPLVGEVAIEICDCLNREFSKRNSTEVGSYVLVPEDAS